MRPHSPLSRRLFLLDLVTTPAGFYLATLVRQALPWGYAALSLDIPFPPAMVYGMVIVSWSVALFVQGVYDPDRVLHWRQETTRVIVASLLATIFLAGMLYLTRTELSRLQFGYALVITLVLLLSVRYAVRTWHRLLGFRDQKATVRILLVGGGALGEQAATVIARYKRWGYRLLGFLDDDSETIGSVNLSVPVLGRIDDLEEIVRQYDIGDVWIALPLEVHEKARRVVDRLAALPVRVHIVPDYFPLAVISATPRDFGGLPVIALRDPVIVGIPRHVKRTFDVVVSFSVLVMLAPMLGVLMALIKWDSSGPVLFLQDRVGENGRIFRMVKLRTMVVDAEEGDRCFADETDLAAIHHKRHADPRVTRFGRLLRRYSLDELPQLFNVFLGEMSLVGPRPELPWLVAKYDLWQRQRLAVPQGMTGWWQVTGRSDKPMHLHTDEDLYYVYNYSLWLDLRILAKTIQVVVKGRGAF
jgi:exopolysaccharide biosynthesis polyprenyl glycosylphosphotransferase